MARRLGLVHTPKHGGWPDVAESELSVPTRRCQGRRVAVPAEVAEEAGAWGERRNARREGVEWHFPTEAARVELRHLYPKIGD